MKLLKEFLKDPYTIGSVTDTSKYTAKFINSLIPKNSNVLEIGSGSGAITKYLKSAKSISSIDTNFEYNRYSDYHNHNDAIKLIKNTPSLVYHDVVISSIPTKLMKPEELHEFLDVVSKKMSNDAIFIQLNYSKSLNKVYESFFSIVYQKVIWRNLPPAVITVMK